MPSVAPRNLLRPGRLGPCLLAAALLAGCRGPVDLPTEARKELYVELLRAEGPVETRPVSAPLDPASMARAFAAVRRLSVGAQDDAQGLLDVLDAPGDDEPAGTEPALLVWTGEPERARTASCYVGHEAFLRQGEPLSLGVIHRLRLLVVNRTGRTLRLPLADLSLAGVAGDDDLEPLDLLGAADARGRVEEALVVADGEAGLLDAFFFAPQLHPRLASAWRVEERGAAGALGTWSFQLPLRRRYVLEAAPLDELEARVAVGEPLPEARAVEEELPFFMEARVDAVGAPAPAPAAPAPAPAVAR